MNYNWPAVVRKLRSIVAANTVLLGNSPEHTRDLRDSFRLELFETDTFHPWNTDAELSRALDRMPNYCDYRKVKPYWAWKVGHEWINESLFDVFEEMNERIQLWFGDQWNFPPGYRPPKDITFKLDTDRLARISTGRIITAAKTPKTREDEAA